MGFKRILALILIIVGTFLVIAQPFSPTGAVIDLSTSSAKVGFFIGATLIILGLIAILAERKIVTTAK